MENKKTWKDLEIEKLEDLLLYIDYLSEVEIQEDDGTEEGEKIVKTHLYYQDKLKAIIKEIISSYHLYKDYNSYDENDSYRDRFRYKFDLVSYLLLASDDVKMEDSKDE